MANCVVVVTKNAGKQGKCCPARHSRTRQPILLACTPFGSCALPLHPYLTFNLGSGTVTVPQRFGKGRQDRQKI